MFTQILRKSFTLLVIYAALIVGIFVLQFKNDSIISEKFGSLHVSLLESIADDNSTSLKNKFNIMFNGITFNGSEDKSAKAKINSKEQNIAIVAWEKLSALSFKLKFSNNVDLVFSVSDEGQHAHLGIEAILPKNVSSFSIPYGFAAGAALSSISDNKLQVSNKKMDWELYAGDIDSNRIIFTQKDRFASYSYYDKARAFEFSLTVGLDVSSESTYNNVIESLKTSLISAFGQHSSDASGIGEQETVAYVAAMAEKGRYNEALDAVPSTFKKSSSRTFLSAPYFDTLQKVNEPLQLQLKSYENLINRAIETNSLDIYNTRFISDYMCMHPGSSAIKVLLTKTASMDFTNISVQNAVSILSVYDELAIKNPGLAGILQNAVEKCIAKIEMSCNLDDFSITVAEKGTFLSVIQAVMAGDAIYRYGKLVNNEAYICGGRMIIASYLKECSSFDLRTLGEIYPIVVHGNSYYPHFEIIAFDKGKVVWTWTCAEKVSYLNDNAGTITLKIKFPLSYSHYLIVNGIDPFKSIYIYDMAFRSDYRFETYNSSGYIYHSDSNSLLLKSRQKSEVEDVRLIYSVAAQEKAEKLEESESTEAKAVKKPVEVKEVKVETETNEAAE